MTALHWLVVEGHGSVAQWLVDDVGADVQMLDLRYGQSALHFAASKNREVLSQILLSRNANLLCTDRYGWTPLHTAARSGSCDVIMKFMEFLNNPTDVDVRGASGQTALHRAAYWCQTEAVELLLKFGANKNAKDSADRRAIDVIGEGGYGCSSLPYITQLLADDDE